MKLMMKTNWVLSDNFLMVVNTSSNLILSTSMEDTDVKSDRIDEQDNLQLVVVVDVMNVLRRIVNLHPDTVLIFGKDLYVVSIVQM